MDSGIHAGMTVLFAFLTICIASCDCPGVQGRLGNGPVVAQHWVADGQYHWIYPPPLPFFGMELSGNKKTLPDLPSLTV
jgi:hypothetical protein